MEANRRFTILTFPQSFDGSMLKVNVVFLPRNQNPLSKAIEGGPLPDAPAFADAKLSFVAKVIAGLTDFPKSTSPSTPVPLPTAVPANARPLFSALGDQFKVSNSQVTITNNVPNTNANVNSPVDKPPAPVPEGNSVRKYLPQSYRKSFNFIAPRTKNAVTDDSYHCAVRDAKPPVPSPIVHSINWGRVFAYALRQPRLAESLGMIYHADLEIKPSYFPKGGWLYIDLADTSDYKPQQILDDDFIKKYAARIPALEPGKKRNVFAAIEFPVLPANPAGNFDNILIEQADYDDGLAKIIHAFQPVSQNLLLEENDGFHPTKEVGIRLGWDDEQILIWYMRQLAEDQNIGPGKRIDSPLGVFGYKIDVRKKGAAQWESLNGVKSKASLKIKDIPIGDFEGELNYQVYPTQLDNDPGKNYWLPMYFANWSGKSMVLPDDDAAAIYHNQDVKPSTETNVTGAPPSNLGKTYDPSPITTKLEYGNIYDFRVRLGDLSGGGPVSQDPSDETPPQVATCHFKRYVAPSTVRIDDVPVNSDELVFDKDKLVIKRPLLGYPSAVFTGKYANAVDLLKKAAEDQVEIAKQNRQFIGNGEPEKVKPLEAFGISDPDVESVEITVEIGTLLMDNLLSVSGKDAYIKFYTTTRKFPAGFDDELSVPLEFKDCNVLKFGDPSDLGDLGLSEAQIDGMFKLVLPTARKIRLTLRAICEKKDGYYGLESENHDFDSRYGRTRHVMLYQASADERKLFAPSSPAKRVQGIYLQPDPPSLFDGQLTTLLLGKEEIPKPPDMIQRLAGQLGIENTGLTLVGKKGERLVFGCSNRIRHTLAPDHSSITFASKGDLMNHWLGCITLQIDRDWTWDALEDVGFVVKRKKRFLEDDIATETEELEVGDIEIKKTVPFNALQNPDRSRTTIIFIDAIETKNERKQPAPNDQEPRFPDLIELEYTMEANFKPDHASQKDDPLVLPLELPITLPPAQVPKIASAGIALSPYTRNAKYSATEPRRRYLWVEFAEPVRDLKDAFFARVLAYAPDQLLSNNNPELWVAPDEPALPVDPEYLRVITPDQSHDDGGIDAMQPMEKAKDSDRHFLLPLPPGLHSESPELFGFFTYEFRVGHYRYQDTDDRHTKGEDVWSTAQGRFGRPLRATGIQHPAPTLTCTVNRDEEKLYATAPYAVAVAKGKNVTSDPPRTEIWCLLYAQVRQADNKDYRNILIDEKRLDWRVRVEHDKNADFVGKYTEAQRQTLKLITINNWKDELDYANFRHIYQLADTTTVNKDATKYGTIIWSDSEISQLLTLYGLPLDSPLSVLCVEMLPTITNLNDHVANLSKPGVIGNLRKIVPVESSPPEGQLKELSLKMTSMQALSVAERRPLSDQLGYYRILRTSPLTEVPFVCCTECK
jgi:hypothetical protein